MSSGNLDSEAMQELLMKTWDRHKIVSKPDRLIVTPEGIAYVVARCEQEPEFRANVIKQFPKLASVL